MVYGNVRVAARRQQKAVDLYTKRGPHRDIIPMELFPFIFFSLP